MLAGADQLPTGSRMNDSFLVSPFARNACKFDCYGNIRMNNASWAIKRSRKVVAEEFIESQSLPISW